MDQQLNYKIKQIRNMRNKSRFIIIIIIIPNDFLLLKSHSNHNIYTHVIKIWMPYFNDNVFLFVVYVTTIVLFLISFFFFQLMRNNFFRAKQNFLFFNVFFNTLFSIQFLYKFKDCLLIVIYFISDTDV